MNGRTSRRIAALLAPILLAGCSGIRTSTDFDPATNFATYRTYDWRPGPQKGPADPRIDNSLLDMRVRRAVDRTLAAKGYTKLSSEQPDFYVGYHAVLEEKTDFRTVGGYYGYGMWGGPPSTYSFRYDEGTLLIDVIDAQTMKLVWRGTATATVEADDTPQQREEAVNQAVEKVFEKFPPR